MVQQWYQMAGKVSSCPRVMEIYLFVCGQSSHVPTAEVPVAILTSDFLEDTSSLKFPGVASYRIATHSPYPQWVSGCAKARGPSYHPEYPSPSWEVYARQPPEPTYLRFPLRSPEAKCWPSGLTCMTRTPAFTSIGIPFSLPRSGRCDMSCRC